LRWNLNDEIFRVMRIRHRTEPRYYYEIVGGGWMGEESKPRKLKRNEA
jgi:hypothetical protein